MNSVLFKGESCPSDFLDKQKYSVLFFFLACKFIIHFFLIDAVYDLHRDEYLHLDQANHLAWGYTSVPPVTSWISYLIKLLGNGLFWVKFFPVLFGALTIFVVWKTIDELKGNLFAFILGTGCITFSTLFRLNILYQPNSLDALCWTLCYFLLLKYLNSHAVKWLFYLAIAFAFGFLNKYNIGFLLLGLVPALLVSAQRKIFLEKKLYLAALLALILISPNLIWQYQEGFPVVKHMRELADTQLVHVERWGFLKAQFFFFFGTFIVIILGLLGLVAYAPFKKYSVFFSSFLFTLAVFLLLKAKDYYAIGLYPVYFAFGSVYLASLLENRVGRVLKPICILLSLLFYVPVYRITFPNKTPEYIATHSEKYKRLGMLRWEDGKEYALPQDFADMLGWKELARKVDSVYAQIPDKEHTLVLCDNYGQAGAINYYSKKGVKATSFSADYINWFDLSKPYKNLIRVKYSGEKERELQQTSAFFETGKLVDSVENSYAREHGTLIFSFREAKVDINKRIRDEISLESGR